MKIYSSWCTERYDNKYYKVCKKPPLKALQSPEVLKRELIQMPPQSHVNITENSEKWLNLMHFCTVPHVSVF